jgi:hypothetical protein
MANVIKIGWLIFGLALATAPLPSTAATDAPRAVFTSTIYDFGTVKQGQEVAHTFVLRNEGTEPLKISQMAVSGRGLKGRFRSLIGAGEEIEIPFVWDTSQVSREVEGKITLYLNDPDQPQVTLVLNGVVIPPIDIVPRSAVFISEFNSKAKRRSVTIINNQHRPLSITGMERDGEHFEAVVETVVPGKQYILHVIQPAGVPIGRYKEAVTLLTDDPSHPSLHVVVNLLVKPDLYVAPPDVDFGRVNIGGIQKTPDMGPIATQIFLVKRRDSEMTITSVTTDVPFLDIRQDPPERGQIFRFDVGLDMDRIVPGKIDGTIIIKTNDPEFPELVVPVRGEIKE